MTDTPLGTMIADLSVEPLRGAREAVATRLVEDSRQVQAGDLFLARAGAAGPSDRFVRQAEQAGAVCILSDECGCGAAAGPALLSTHVQLDGAILANRLLGDPSYALRLVGVTGTNGKTTLTTLLHTVLGVTQPCGLLGGVSIDDGMTSAPARLTTPMADEVASWVARCVASGCPTAVMEISSHAMDQHRIGGLHLTAAVFTNLSGDHLDYHHTMDRYAACKRQLFESLASGTLACTNLDDPRGRWMVEGTAADVLACSVSGQGDVRGVIRDASTSGSLVEVSSPWGSATMQIPLVGQHNVSNALQVMAVACWLGTPIEEVAAILAKAPGPPGRLEVVPAVASQPLVLVDFAHTDGALDAMLGSLRSVMGPDQKLTVVFGCGGDRDRTKRPRMGAVAAVHADHVWVTSDNPRGESPEAIMNDIFAGIPDGVMVHAQADRAEAIAEAISLSGPNDVVVIAGKGHEQVQLIGDRAEPFDDRVVAAACLQADGTVSS